MTLTAFPRLREADDLMLDGKLERAAERVMLHLRQHPDEPRGLSLLGQIAMRLGALGQAAHFLQRAVARGAQDFETRRALASTMNQQERLEDACAMFAALEGESDDPTLPGVRAQILEKLGRHAEAMTIQERLTQTHGQRPHPWIAYGHSLRAAGRVDEAVAAYRTAIAVDMECGEAWWGLASIKRRVLDETDIAQMREGLAVAIDIRNTAPLHFALARALHDRGEYGEAFAHYAEGNSQRAKAIAYDPRGLSSEIEEMVRTVDSDFFEPPPMADTRAVTPVFIVSLPRSGSTLLEQMLGSHPAIEPIGELPYIPAILRSAMEMATRRGRSTVLQLIASISDEDARAMGNDYLRRAASHRKTDRAYFIDKLPHNWSNIPFVRRILPQARFIDIRRAPMDCCFSNYTQSFSSAHAASFSLSDIGQCYVDYHRLMTHLDTVVPDMICHVPYTRLIEDAEGVLRPVFDYLGLPWDPAVLEFHALDRVVRTPSSEQVRRPLNRDGVEIWKPYAEWLGPLRQALGPHADQ